MYKAQFNILIKAAAERIANHPKWQDKYFKVGRWSKSDIEKGVNAAIDGNVLYIPDYQIVRIIEVADNL